MTTTEIVIALNGKSESERSIPIALSLAESQRWGIQLLTFVEASYDVIAAQLYLGAIQTRLAAEYPDLCCRISVEVEPHAPEGLIRYGA